MIHKKKIDPPKLEQYIDNSAALIGALESVEESVYMFDATTDRAIYANRSILHILGYTTAQIGEMGTAWSEIVVHPDDYPYLSTHIANYQQLSPGSRSRVVYRVKDPHGKWHAAESTGLVLAPRAAGRKLVLSTTRLIPETDATTPKNGHDHRCNNCARLLGKENYEKAAVEIKCPRCGEYNDVSMQ